MAIAASLVTAAAPAQARTPPPRVFISVSPPASNLFGARAQAREIHRARPHAVVTILLGGGTYRLGRTLVLDSRDSRVTWRAAPRAHPVIGGAIRVRGWKLHDRARRIWVAEVPKDVETRQLYVSGTRATRARGAEYPPGFTRTPAGFQAPNDSMASWRNPTGIEAVTLTQWKMMRCPLAGISGDEIALEEPCWTNVNVFPYLWSFQTLTWLENAYELLDKPGEWYLDGPAGRLYYIPRAGQRLGRADVELPRRQALVDLRGTPAKPVERIRFEHITFAYGTWLAPSGPNGYADDQSGFHLDGAGHQPNLIGHDPDTDRTPGSVRLRYARRISFVHDDFLHLGGVGLDFNTGSKHDSAIGNRFADISSAAIEVGGVAKVDHHPRQRRDITADNVVSNNLIRHTGVEYADSAAIYVGFTARTLVAHNDIADVPWSGIATGWGWGLLDPGGFTGLPNGTVGMWGPGGAPYTTPTPNRGNRIVDNRISNFLEVLWDGGAVYNTGFQGTSPANGELIVGNVAIDKRRLAGGNVFYTDGGSRYIRLEHNVSFDNPPGQTDFGPCGLPDSLLICGLVIPYGSDTGGCRPYGDLTFDGNYWEYLHFYLDACPYPPYPVDVTSKDHTITSISDVPPSLLAHAGLQPTYRLTVGAAR